MSHKKKKGEQPKPLFPAVLYVQPSICTKGEYNAFTDDVEDGEIVGVYTLTDVRRCIKVEHREFESVPNEKVVEDG